MKNKIVKIPKKFKEVIARVALYIGDSSDDWIAIKLQIVNNSLNKHRDLFSRRHEFTRKQEISEFDKLVMEYWKELTGVIPVIPPEKIHDPTWQHRGRSWNVLQINERRRLEKLKNEKEQHKKKKI